MRPVASQLWNALAGTSRLDYKRLGAFRQALALHEAEGSTRPLQLQQGALRQKCSPSHVNYVCYCVWASITCVLAIRLLSHCQGQGTVVAPLRHVCMVQDTPVYQGGRHTLHTHTSWHQQAWSPHGPQQHRQPTSTSTKTLTPLAHPQAPPSVGPSTNGVILQQRQLNTHYRC